MSKLTPVSAGSALLIPNHGLSAGKFTYSIPTSASTWSYPEEPASRGYGVLDQRQTVAMVAAIDAWDRLIAPTFTRTDDLTAPGVIRVAFTSYDMDADTWGYAYLVRNSISAAEAGDIWINPSDGVRQSAFLRGGFDYMALLHEIGHTLGLDHSTDLAGFPVDLDDTHFTVMSYTRTAYNHWTFAATANGFVATPNKAFAQDPMVLDIAAVQAKYGADPTTATGDDIYVFDENTPFLQAIYDAAGVDTIDLSNHSRGSILNLTPGAYSDIAMWPSDMQAAYWISLLGPGSANLVNATFNKPGNQIYTWANNLGLAHTTLIENAKGGAGDDTITGNQAANRLEAGAGRDTLYGMAGNDVLVGGQGVDHLWGGAGDDYLILGPTSYGFGGDGFDTIDGSALDWALTTDGTAERVIGSRFNDAIGMVSGGAQAEGRGGNDGFTSGPGSDAFDGGDGSDSVSYTYQERSDVIPNIVVNLSTIGPQNTGLGLDTLSSIEGLYSGYGNDVLIGNASDNVLSGFRGDNLLLGLGGNDRLTSEFGSDRLFGGAGDDILEYATQYWGAPPGPNIDVFDGGLGDDILRGAADLGSTTAAYEDPEITSGVTVDLRISGQQDTVGAGRDTLINVRHLIGSAFTDVLVGDDRDNQLLGGTGNDIVVGQEGADYLVAGDGADQAVGGEGNDTLLGQGDNDTHYGGAGADQVYGGLGDDVAYGGEGVDFILGEEGADYLIGEAGGDTLLGADGDDTLFGQGEGDTLFGGLSVDLIYGGLGDDVAHGDDGADVLLGEEGADTLFGGAGADLLVGQDGADYLIAGDGADQLAGGEGNDTLQGQADNDTHYGGAGADQVSGGLGDDVVYGDDGADILVGEEGADTLFGGADNDIVVGQDGADYLIAGEGADQVVGGEGNDTLLGQGDSDTHYGGAGSDQIYGGLGDDVAYGEDGADILVGEEGADTLLGGTGNDTLSGGAGADVFRYASGDGSDVIGDFDLAPGQDRLGLFGMGWSTAAEVRAAGAQNGADFVISTGGGSITLLGITGASLRDDCFIFG